MRSQYVTIKMTLRQARAAAAILNYHLNGKTESGFPVLVLDKGERRVVLAAEERVSDVVHQADVEYHTKSERIWREYREQEAKS